jgi:hypothetical protein
MRNEVAYQHQQKVAGSINRDSQIMKLQRCLHTYKQNYKVINKDTEGFSLAVISLKTQSSIENHQNWQEQNDV